MAVPGLPVRRSGGTGKIEKIIRPALRSRQMIAKDNDGRKGNDG